MKFYLTLALVALLLDLGYAGKLPKDLKSSASEQVAQEVLSELDADDVNNDNTVLNNVASKNEETVSNTVNLLETNSNQPAAPSVENVLTKTYTTVNETPKSVSSPKTPTLTLSTEKSHVPEKTFSVLKAIAPTRNTLPSQNLQKTVYTAPQQYLYTHVQPQFVKYFAVEHPQQLVSFPQHFGYSVKHQPVLYTTLHQEPQHQGYAPLEYQAYPVPQYQTFSVPQHETFSVPQHETFPVPEHQTFSVPQQEAVLVTKQETVSVPKQETVSVPKQETVSVPKQETVSVPKQETVSVPKQETVSVTKQETVSVPQQPLVVSKSKSVQPVRKQTTYVQHQVAKSNYQPQAVHNVVKTYKISNPTVSYFNPTKQNVSKQTVLTGSQLASDSSDPSETKSVVVQEAESNY